MRLGGIDADGRVAVQVDVGGFLGIGSKLIEIKAMDLKYEQGRNKLTTSLRKPAIESLSAIKTQDLTFYTALRSLGAPFFMTDALRILPREGRRNTRPTRCPARDKDRSGSVPRAAARAFPPRAMRECSPVGKWR